MAENTHQNQEEAPRKKKSSPIGFIIIVIILVGLLGFISWLYIDQKQTTQQITMALEEEKDSLKSNLIELRTEYDSLKTTNDSLNQKLNVEQEKIDGLLSELKNVKATNYTKIKRLKDEVKTLRDIAKSYVRQIDSLNQLNKQLAQENREVKRDLKKTQESKKELEKAKDSLSQQVKKVKVLRIENLKTVGLNDRSKEKTKVNKIDKLKTCFTIKENVLLKPGDRTFYIRIASPPDDFILTNSEDNLFEHKGKKLVYSASRTVEYDGKKQNLCIYFDSKGELKPGTYEVYVFATGKMVGQTSFKLEESGWLFF
jgi:DNA repair exonuclease SbcCD ATPase subunit